MRSRNRLVWIGSQDEEMDLLLVKLDALMEVWEDELEVSPHKVWLTKFVNAVKTHAITGKERARSRLVCMGQNQKEGRDYTDKSCPTPPWPLVLINIIHTSSIAPSRTAGTFSSTSNSSFSVRSARRRQATCTCSRHRACVRRAW